MALSCCLSRRSNCYEKRLILRRRMWRKFLAENCWWESRENLWKVKNVFNFTGNFFLVSKILENVKIHSANFPSKIHVNFLSFFLTHQYTSKVLILKNDNIHHFNYANPHLLLRINFNFKWKIEFTEKWRMCCRQTHKSN